MLYNIVGKRFHECLMAESEQNQRQELSMTELVHQVCRKQRLTFYNLLLERNDTPSEQIKAAINREYAIYFHRK